MRSAGLRVLTLGLILGLCLGFILANIIYRVGGAERPNVNLQSRIPSKTSESTDSLPEASGATESRSQTNISQNVLSIDELHQAVVKADGEKDNLQLQRDLGIALFKYAALEQKTDLLPDCIRLLERAQNKPFVKDKELYETYGNALFVLAQLEESQKMPLARGAYQKALEIEPKNADLLVNIGLTYFFQKPSNSSAAVKEFNQALNLQPLNERALEGLTIALLELRQTVKAGESLKKLREVNPQNNRIDDLQTQLIQEQLIVR